MHHFSYAVERLRAVIDRSRGPATARGRDYRRPKCPNSGAFIPPIGDQDVLTIVLLSVIAILSRLDFMLVRLDLSAVIAKYNQF
jgi:hypothetical protein